MLHMFGRLVLLTGSAHPRDLNFINRCFGKTPQAFMGDDGAYRVLQLGTIHCFRTLAAHWFKRTRDQSQD
jgi:hypothetical protein